MLPNRKAPLFRCGVRERFWGMFVVDAFIENPDRNNGNRGLLMDAARNYELAWVRDLGSSLFSKRSPSLAESRLPDESEVEQDAVWKRLLARLPQDHILNGDCPR